MRTAEIAGGILTLRLNLRSKWWWAAAAGLAILAALAGGAKTWFHWTPASPRVENAAPRTTKPSGLELPLFATVPVNRGHPEAKGAVSARDKECGQTSFLTPAMSLQGSGQIRPDRDALSSTAFTLPP
jgi:hypothetical protein